MARSRGRSRGRIAPNVPKAGATGGGRKRRYGCGGKLKG